MKNYLLLTTLILAVFASATPLSAAAGKAVFSETATHSEAAAPAKTSTKQQRKAQRWAKRFERLEKKFEKKMEKQRSKGKTVTRINLGETLGLIVLLTGGLFIALGLVIPAVGFVFLVIGIVIAFAGLLLWLLLGGISVEVS